MRAGCKRQPQRVVGFPRGEHRGSAIHLHRIELPAVTGIRQGHGNLCQCADIERDLQAVAIRIHFRGHDLGTVAAALGRPQ